MSQPSPRRSLVAVVSATSALLLAAACGGGGKPAPAEPRAMVAEGDRAEAAMAYGGAAYGGAAYGGAAYGGIAQQWHDPCAGDPCGPLTVQPPPPPPDPPELASYLPARSPRPPGQPDPAAHYAVPLHDSPSSGPKAAPVTLVVTFEFADPYGDRLRPTLDQLAASYGADLKIVWKHFIVHYDRAQVSALAACAAARQGKFQPFMNAMFAASIAPGGNRRFDLEATKIVASGQGLDLARFDKDLRSDACKAEVIRDQQLFESLGQGAVPVCYINGRVLQGAQPYDSFAKLIDEELATARTALSKRGAKVEDYYPGLVKTGRTAP
jgi:protein-disulfide isomerase